VWTLVVSGALVEAWLGSGRKLPDYNCKIKAVNPPFRIRVHSAVTKGLTRSRVG
jgi:hypothetical protein